MFRVRIRERVLLSYGDVEEARDMAQRLSRQFPGVRVEVLEKMHSGKRPYMLRDVFESGVHSYTATITTEAR